MARKRWVSELEKLVRDQWGVVAWRQSRALGVGEDEIRGMVARGQLHRLHRGVYAYGLREHLPRNGVLLAAQLAVGDSAYLTRRTALGYFKVCGLYEGRLEVTVVAPAARPRELPLSVATTTVPPTREELRTHRGLRIASVARALLELSPDTGKEKLDALITEAIHLGKLTHRQMLELLERHARRPGIGNLREAYAAYQPRPKSRSGLERAFDRELKRRPWIPDPKRNVHIEAGGINWEVDRFWEEFGLGVELHGNGYYKPQADIEQDHRKAAAQLLAIGLVLFDATDVRLELEPGPVLDDLEAILRARGWEGREPVRRAG
jgi:hypothetical protein